MVKNSKKLSKSGKSEENLAGEEDTLVEPSNEDSSVIESADGDLKKKGKAKSAKKEEESEENGEEIKENGADPPAEKKKAAPKKPKAVKKPAVEPERKSSRQPKPVLKETDQNEKRGQKRKASKSPARAKRPKAAKVEKDYEVEEVVGLRIKKGKKEYRIRWKGYKPSQDTWEPERHLSCTELIEKYIEENKDKETGSKPKTPVKRSKSSAKSGKKRKAK